MKWTDSAWIMFFISAGVMAQNTSPPTSQPAATQPAATQPAELDDLLDDPDLSEIKLQRSLLAELDRVRSEAILLLPRLGANTRAPQTLVIGQLEDLSQQCRTLATKLSGQTDRLESAHVALKIRYCLVAGESDTQLALDRIDQLRVFARWTKQLGCQEAEELGRFWLLQADLIRMKFDSMNIDAYQRQVMVRLERYISRPKLTATDVVVNNKTGLNGSHSPVVSSMLEAAKSALVRIYHQIGATDRACDLAVQLRACMHRGNKAGRTYLDRVIEDCSLLGLRFEAQCITDDGLVWSSAAHRGNLVLLHFWASWAMPSVEMVDQLRFRYAKLNQCGLSILSVSLDAQQQDDADCLSVDWPTVSKKSGHAQLSDLFQITSLPTFVLIDRRGHVAAVGGSLGVLDGAEGLSDADPLEYIIASGIAQNDHSNQVGGGLSQKARGSAATQPAGSILPGLTRRLSIEDGSQETP